MLIRHCRKFHLYHEFKRMYVQTNRMAQIKDKSKIDGAYLILKRFKLRLKAFDTALQAVNEQKVNKIEF